jgi:hypothetical protein
MVGMAHGLRDIAYDDAIRHQYLHGLERFDDELACAVVTHRLCRSFGMLNVAETAHKNGQHASFGVLANLAPTNLASAIIKRAGVLFDAERAKLRASALLGA